MSSILNKFWSQQFREAATSVYTIIALTGVVAYLIYAQTRFKQDTYDEQDYWDAGHGNLLEPLSGLVLTKEQLLELFNCNNPDRRYLVALRDVVYDVSNMPEDFGPKGRFATWSGHELTENIKAEALRKKKNVKSFLRKWSEMLETCFFVAGELIDYEAETEENAEENDNIDVTVEDLEDDEDDFRSRGDSIRWEDNNPNAEEIAEVNANIDVTMEDDEDDLRSRGDSIRWEDNDDTIIPSR